LFITFLDELVTLSALEQLSMLRDFLTHQFGMQGGTLTLIFPLFQMRMRGSLLQASCHCLPLSSPSPVWISLSRSYSVMGATSISVDFAQETMRSSWG